METLVIAAVWLLILYAYAEAAFGRRTWWLRLKCNLKIHHHRGFLSNQQRVISLTGGDPLIWIVTEGSVMVRRHAAVVVFSPPKCVDCDELEIA